MFLEAIWLKNGKEVYKVAPVMNIVCDKDMNHIKEIEIDDGNKWHEYNDFKGDSDDFVIRLVKDEWDEDYRCN